MMSGMFEGKVALITNAARDVGREIALAMVQEAPLIHLKQPSKIEKV